MKWFRFLLHAATAFSICAVFAAESDFYRLNPAKVLGSENCAECHAAAVEALKLTHHYTTFITTHQSDAAKSILPKMGLRRMKVESVCIKCHYTSQGPAESAKVISGISCESCHNAGADWNKVHSNKDDPDRLAKAEKLGMLRPSNFYHVAANCFACHTVPEEKLVNVGGHSAGSPIELVAWSQGEVRHNVQKSAGKVNEEAPQPAKRMLYILGQGLDLEYGLRGLAKATETGKFSDSLVSRIQAATTKLKTISETLKIDDLKPILDAVNPADLKPNNSQPLLQAADKIAAAAQKFSSGNDGLKFAAIDPMIPGPDQYKGKVYKP
jgi:hypothetical protein